MILAYVDQGNIVASFRNDNDTPKSVAYEDSKYYLFSESNRLRAEISEDYLSPNVFIPLVHYDFDTAEYKNSGKQEITGTTYYFDRYTIKMTDGTETLLEIYIDDLSDYAAEEVTALFKLGFINGNDDGTLNPLGTSTRAEGAQVLYNVLTK